MFTQYGALCPPRRRQSGLLTSAGSSELSSFNLKSAGNGQVPLANYTDLDPSALELSIF